MPQSELGFYKEDLMLSVCTHHQFRENRIGGDFNAASPDGIIWLSIRFIEDLVGPLCVEDKIVVADGEGNRCVGEVLGLTGRDDEEGYLCPVGIKIQLDFDTWEDGEDNA
jgi:hypothetical protein